MKVTINKNKLHNNICNLYNKSLLSMICNEPLKIIRKITQILKWVKHVNKQQTEEIQMVIKHFYKSYFSLIIKK